MFQYGALNTNWNRCEAQWTNENEKISMVLENFIFSLKRTVYVHSLTLWKARRETNTRLRWEKFSRLATVWRKQYRELLQEKPISSPLFSYPTPQSFHVKWLCVGGGENFQLRQRTHEIIENQSKMYEHPTFKVKDWIQSPVIFHPFDICVLSSDNSAR